MAWPPKSTFIHEIIDFYIVSLVGKVLIEYDIAYMFASSEDDWTIGGDGPYVILKETGEAKSRLYSFEEFYEAQEIRGFQI